ncbi:MAG: cation transporter [Holophaga sp.]|nr:cation transporter [Holophaga sp.]
MIKLKITGMSCNNCVNHVSHALAGVAGVSGPVEVSLERGEATVAGTAEPKALVAAVEAEGYHAVLVP